MSLDGRIALVTGASRGIGRAVALALAEDGADVAVHYNRDLAAAEESAEAIRALGRRAVPVAAAIQDPGSLATMVELVQKELGPVGILVNNAGVASQGRSVLKTEAEELEALMRIHALGPHELCKRVLPGMREQARGDIVMVSSMATKYNAAGGAPYNMGKAAMEALAFTLAAEERRFGIRVNVVAPGLVETEMGRRLIKATSGIEDLRQLDEQMPFGRVCQPEDIANTIRHIVSDRSAYTTGQWIGIDGGGQ
jgi:3-oxoacyl-[acyl-carrier protein] reductase